MRAHLRVDTRTAFSLTDPAIELALLANDSAHALQ
jgi:hypothetical protein